MGYNYGKILFDTWIKHAGSIEKFLYKRINQDMNQPFSKSSNNENSPLNEKKNGVRIKKVKSFSSNKSHFEDLSQFVLASQNKSNNQLKLNSILKRENSKNNSVNSNLSEISRRKRVSIGNEYHLYG